MGKTSKIKQELAVDHRRKMFLDAVNDSTSPGAAMVLLGEHFFSAFPGVPFYCGDQRKVDRHRVYFNWTGVGIGMQKSTTLPIPTEAEVMAALLALAEDAAELL